MHILCFSVFQIGDNVCCNKGTNCVMATVVT